MSQCAEPFQWFGSTSVRELRSPFVVLVFTSIYLVELGQRMFNGRCARLCLVPTLCTLETSLDPASDLFRNIYMSAKGRFEVGTGDYRLSSASRDSLRASRGIKRHQEISRNLGQHGERWRVIYGPLMSSSKFSEVFDPPAAPRYGLKFSTLGRGPMACFQSISQAGGPSPSIVSLNLRYKTAPDSTAESWRNQSFS